MNILESDVSQIKKYIKTMVDNKEWLKNLQNDEEGKKGKRKIKNKRKSKWKRKHKDQRR